MIATEPYIPRKLSASTRQADVLAAIRDFIQVNHYPPTVRELGDMVGLSSSSTVQHHVNELARKGYISHRPGLVRTIVVLEDWPV